MLRLRRLPRYIPSRWRDIFTELKPELSGKAVLLVGSEDQCGGLGELESLLRSAGIENAKIHLPEDLVELLDLIAAAELVMTVDTAAAHFAAGLDEALRHPLLRSAPRHVRPVATEHPATLATARAAEGKNEV